MTALRVRTCHLAQIPLHERGPARVGPRLRLRIRNQFAARAHLRQPHVEEVLLRVILLPDTARQQPDGAEPNAFTAHSRRTKTYDLNHV
jgi:hypothetical protein